MIFFGGIVVTGLFLYFYFDSWCWMSKAEIAKAERALANGITIEDPKNDFVIMSSNKEEPNAENNPSPYGISYLDVKSVSVGIDDDNLYFKTTYYDKIPNTLPNMNGDQITDIGNKLNLTNKEGVEQIDYDSSYEYIAPLRLHLISAAYNWGQTGIVWPESARMKYEGKDCRAGGGPGTDSIIAVYPLKKVGLKRGDLIYFNFAEEARSKKYTHAAVDVLGGVGKMPAFITWKSDTKQFTKNDNYWQN